MTDADLRRALAHEAELRAALVHGDKAGAAATAMQQAAEGWWAASADALEAMRDRAASLFGMEEAMFLQAMTNNARALAEGHLPAVCQFADRKSFSIARRRDLAAGIYYVLACQAGRIADPSPFATVAAAFGVSQAYVRRWVKERKSRLSGCQEAGGPAAVAHAMQAAGAQYRFNSGQEATGKLPYVFTGVQDETPNGNLCSIPVPLADTVPTIRTGANKRVPAPPAASPTEQDDMKKIAVTIPEAVEMTAIGRTRLYALIKSGELPAKKIGSRTLILVEDIERFMRGLADMGSEKAA